MSNHVRPNEKQDYYAHSVFRLCPFEHMGDVAVNAFSKEQLQRALDWCGDDALVMTVEDNGPHGDGILLEVTLANREDSRPMVNNPVVWMRLSLAGAKALSASLAHIVRMREIEAQATKE